MKTVKIFGHEITGVVKPMHAVNNGPVHKFAADQRISNLDAFREAGIPYVRNHDASFYATYGGSHTVDVHAVFPNFDADPYDESSYDFACTDEYLRVIALSGAQTYYRLGSKIEHEIKKYGTLPPKDFKKWAVICEHIIRHFNEGFANGFHMNLTYWEIWNEADLDPDDSDHKRNWGGTKEQFYELFNIALTHLKTCFPHLKIGGPAVSWVRNEEWLERLFESLDTKPDFFSWHLYAKDVEDFVRDCRYARELLDRHGLEKTESILNEWNYVKGWLVEDWIYSIKQMKSLKGASFIAAVMSVCQYEPLDMLMYYDARPCAMNGMFSTDIPSEKLKGYYPFLMFGKLYRMGSALRVNSSEVDNIYACAAKAEDGKIGIMLTCFDDQERESSCEVEIELASDQPYQTAKMHLLDQTHDMESVPVTLRDGKLRLHMTLFSTVLIELE